MKSKMTDNQKSEFYNVKFNPDPKIGLTQEQVNSRVNDGLTNKNVKHYTKSYWEIFKTNVLTFFNIFLFIIAGSLIAVKRYSSLFFLVVQLGNILIGIVQDIRAKIAIEKMRIVTEARVDVIRDGEVKSIKNSDIVLNDLVKVSNGKQIVVDGRVVEGVIEVNESLLTGESISIKKVVGDKVFAGSYVTSGNATIIVRKVGEDSYVQQLQKKAKVIVKPKSELLNSLNTIFRFISFIVVPMAIFMIVGNYVQLRADETLTTGERISELVGKTAGSLVSMIPAGMFLLTSMTLAVGVINLSKKKAFVQELYSIEALARVDVICLDKTGTLTDGTMNFDKTISLGKYSEKQIHEILGSYLRAVGDDNHTSRALEKEVPLNEKYISSRRLPFSSERKYSAVTLKQKGTFYLGAPDYLYKGDDKNILKQIKQYSEKGNRVIFFASSSKAINEKGTLPEDLTPVAMFILSDQIRPDAYDTIAGFQDNEVDVKIISGDNPAAVAEIAKEVGVKYAERYISLEGMSIDQVEKIARDYTVFGRVSPEQKAAIIRSLRKHKYTPAMVGDGVNDILALKEADCSVAMAAGSEAARDIAHIVLVNSNFSVLPDVVAEGRRCINNLQRVSSVFLVKTVFSILFSLIWLVIMFSTPGAGANTYPFQTQHMYIWEILSIGAASFFIALQPNKNKISGSFMQNVLRQALPSGVLITMMMCILYIFKTNNLYDVDQENTFLAIGCLIMYVMSYAVLFRICLPFNWYKGILYVVLLGAAVLCMCFNEYIVGFNFLGFKLSELSSSSVTMAIILLLSGILIYALINICIHFYEKYHEVKRKHALKILQTKKTEDELDEY